MPNNKAIELKIIPRLNIEKEEIKFSKKIKLVLDKKNILKKLNSKKIIIDENDDNPNKRSHLISPLIKKFIS